jgi:hypothetical protein
LEIDLRNSKNKEFNIEVQDLIPMSRDEDIEITIGDLFREILDSETGIIT